MTQVNESIKSTATSVTIKKEVTTVVEVPMVNVLLTMHDAEVLLALLGNVGGDAKNNPREVTDRLYHAIRYQAPAYHYDKYPKAPNTGNVFFKDYIKGFNSPDQ